MALGHSGDLSRIIFRKYGRGGILRDGAPNSCTVATSATLVPLGYVASEKKPTPTDCAELSFSPTPRMASPNLSPPSSLLTAAIPVRAGRRNPIPYWRRAGPAA